MQARLHARLGFGFSAGACSTSTNASISSSSSSCPCPVRVERLRMRRGHTLCRACRLPQRPLEEPQPEGCTRRRGAGRQPLFQCDPVESLTDACVDVDELSHALCSRRDMIGSIALAGGFIWSPSPALALKMVRGFAGARGMVAGGLLCTLHVCMHACRHACRHARTHDGSAQIILATLHSTV
eukprot:364265-Chlamydomonas_euryale.AAC.18